MEGCTAVAVANSSVQTSSASALKPSPTSPEKGRKPPTQSFVTWSGRSPRGATTVEEEVSFGFTAERGTFTKWDFFDGDATNGATEGNTSLFEEAQARAPFDALRSRMHSLSALGQSLQRESRRHIFEQLRLLGLSYSDLGIRRSPPKLAMNAPATCLHSDVDGVPRSETEESKCPHEEAFHQVSQDSVEVPLGEAPSDSDLHSSDGLPLAAGDASQAATASGEGLPTHLLSDSSDEATKQSDSLVGTQRLLAGAEMHTSSACEGVSRQPPPPSQEPASSSQVSHQEEELRGGLTLAGNPQAGVKEGPKLHRSRRPDAQPSQLSVKGRDRPHKQNVWHEGKVSFTLQSKVAFAPEEADTAARANGKNQKATRDLQTAKARSPSDGLKAFARTTSRATLEERRSCVLPEGAIPVEEIETPKSRWGISPSTRSLRSAPLARPSRHPRWKAHLPSCLFVERPRKPMPAGKPQVPTVLKRKKPRSSRSERSRNLSLD